MKRLTTWFFAAAVLASVVPASLADSFQFTLNSSVTEYMENTDNDNIMGIYQTPADAWGTQGGVNTGVSGYGNSPFSNVSFFIPAGNVVTSATMVLSLPGSVQGTADVFFTGGGRLPLHPPDPWGPVSIPATLDPSGHSEFFVDGLALIGNEAISPYESVFDISNFLIVDGNELSTFDLENLRIFGGGELHGGIATQGYNYASYMGGTGQATVPYTLEIVGTYSPVPEPSSIALLGTGLIGLAGFARRKYLS